MRPAAPVLKNRPVNTSVGTKTSAEDVFVNKMLSVFPVKVNSAEAARDPLEPENVIEVAPPGAETRVNTVRTIPKISKFLFFMVFFDFPWILFLFPNNYNRKICANIPIKSPNSIKLTDIIKKNN